MPGNRILEEKKHSSRAKSFAPEVKSVARLVLFVFV